MLSSHWSTAGQYSPLIGPQAAAAGGGAAAAGPGGGGEPVGAEPEVPRAQEARGDDGHIPGLLRRHQGGGAAAPNQPRDPGQDRTNVQ